MVVTTDERRLLNYGASLEYANNALESLVFPGALRLHISIAGRERGRQAGGGMSHLFPSL